MPTFFLTLSGDRDPEMIERVVPALTALGTTTLRKRPDLSVVMVRHVPRRDWFIDNVSLEASGRNAFRLEVTITDGTNTREEKAAFHRQAYELMESMVENLHPHSNIHVIDCRGDSYGYEGVTQDRRFHGG